MLSAYQPPFRATDAFERMMSGAVVNRANLDSYL